VLGHRRSGDRQVPGQLTHRARAPRQELEDRPPGWITEQPEPFNSVSVH
jgi:hypothetical protein